MTELTVLMRSHKDCALRRVSPLAPSPATPLSYCL